MEFPDIQEPMTAATDLLIAAVSFYAFFRLRRRWPGPDPCEALYLWFFLLMGVSTVFGAFLSHAFAYVFPPGKSNLLPNWVTNALSVSCFPLALIERAHQIRPMAARRFLVPAVLIETAAVLFLLLWTMNYLYAEIHIGVILYVFSIPLLVRLWKDGYREEAVLCIVATGLMTLIPIVLVLKLHFGTFMNDFDISHLIITAAMYLYYRAGLRWRPVLS